MLGVLYHVKHPLLALEVIHDILKPEGVACIEGELLLHYTETSDNKKVSTPEFVTQLADSDMPLCLIYPGYFKGTSNWFIPNLACLQSWLKACGFEIVSKKIQSIPRLRVQRYICKIRISTSKKKVTEEHPVHTKTWLNKFPNVVYRKAILHKKIGEYKTAEILFKQCLELQSNQPFHPLVMECRFHLLELFKMKKMKNHAMISQLIRDLSEWLAESKKSVNSSADLYTIGSHFKQMGNLDESIDCFKKVLSHKKGLEQKYIYGGYFHLGEAFYNKGQLSQAKKYFSQCLALNPSHKRSKEYLALLKN